jgi:hypothetical protein
MGNEYGGFTSGDSNVEVGKEYREGEVPQYLRRMVSVGACTLQLGGICLG